MILVPVFKGILINTLFKVTTYECILEFSFFKKNSTKSF